LTGHPNTVRPARPLVLVKGAGDFASGIIHRLVNAGYSVVATELRKPKAVRRLVAFSEAVHEGKWTVEGVTAELCTTGTVDRALARGRVAVLVDPQTKILGRRKFEIVVDARSAKRNLGTRKSEAPAVIAIGPGFSAGKDCHAVVETLPGAGIGRVILKGRASNDTGEPTPLEGTLGGASAACCALPCACGMQDVRSLVLRAPRKGVYRESIPIGARVKAGEVVGTVAGAPVVAGADGILRGIIRDGTPVAAREKLGDIDPTFSEENLRRISEKARAIAGGVLEAAMLLDQKRGPRC
jgi:xanthine dehydrogenase accessory factor